MGDLFGRLAIEEAILSGVNLSPSTKHTDGTYPHNFWVSKGGADGDNNGSFERPFLTWRRAIREARNGRRDRVLGCQGSYTETIDIGAGDTSYGPSGGYQKAGLQLIGDNSGYNGRVQIVGDGSTAQATIRVQAGYLGGFALKNVELDVTTVTQPALHLVTNDTGASPAASDANYRFLIENVAVRSDNPNVGILLEGTTLGTFRKIWIQGPTIGIGFCGSANNYPSDLDFEGDLDFRDCVTADLATVASSGTPTTISATNLINIAFGGKTNHWDRGGTPVTDYMNFVGTMVNVHVFNGRWARDVADGTLTQLPANVVLLGHSAAGVESIIGA